MQQVTVVHMLGDIWPKVAMPVSSSVSGRHVYTVFACIHTYIHTCILTNSMLNVGVQYVLIFLDPSYSQVMGQQCGRNFSNNIISLEFSCITYHLNIHTHF
jgi:hypothetical protein